MRIHWVIIYIYYSYVYVGVFIKKHGNNLHTKAKAYAHANAHCSYAALPALFLVRFNQRHFQRDFLFPFLLFYFSVCVCLLPAASLIIDCFVCFCFRFSVFLLIFNSLLFSPFVLNVCGSLLRCLFSFSHGKQIHHLIFHPRNAKIMPKEIRGVRECEFMSRLKVGNSFQCSSFQPYFAHLAFTSFLLLRSLSLSLSWRARASATWKFKVAGKNTKQVPLTAVCLQFPLP